MADKKKWVRTEYGEKLRDPRWQKMRLEVMQRDEFACQMCFDTKSTLNVHHRWYVAGRDPWDYPIESLITLCELCHEQETEQLREQTDYLVHVLKTAGAMAREFSVLVEPFHYPWSGGPPDTWDVIAFGIAEIMHARYHDTQEWTDLRERYYAAVRERLSDDGGKS